MSLTTPCVCCPKDGAREGWTMAQHVCSRCEQEAIPERCPYYTLDESWGPEDMATLTNPDTPEAHLGVLEALEQIRVAAGLASTRPAA